MTSPCKGVRFAPSPTGRFHLGNLRTAWVSHEWALALGLPWIVRFEDIDRPRVVAGSQEKQLEDMARLGLCPAQVLLQSDFHSRHFALFEKARAVNQVYPCTCSRKDLLEALHASASAPHGEAPIYHGKCRNRPPEEVLRESTSHPTIAWRFRSDDPSGAEDFIVARTPSRVSSVAEREFIPAYHWACAIDDYDGEYELLVRARDLASAVRSQRAIHAWLRESERTERKFPAVFHASLVTGEGGTRLEKRTRGITLPELEKSGWKEDGIVAKFRASFHAEPAQFAPEKVWGEARQTISLKELGFSVVQS